MEESIERLEVSDGSCTIPFLSHTPKEQLDCFPLILDPSGIIEDRGDADYRISEQLPSPYHSISLNENPLVNLIAPKIFGKGNDLGYIVNGVSYLKKNGFEQWINFPNFLVDYVENRFGKKWFQDQLREKVEEQHSLARLYRLFSSAVSKGIYESPNQKAVPSHNGVVAWYMDFAFNLFWIDNNDGIQSVMIDRLKSPDHFWSTVHEVFVAAIFCRAGFSLEFEDESDGSTKHPEFIATHRRTGVMVSVEAKAFRREQIEKFDFADWAVGGFRAGRLLNNAAAKSKGIPHYIILDVVHPPLLNEEDQLRFNDKIAKFLDNYHPSASENNRDRWNAIYFVNRPFLFTDNTEHGCMFSVLSAWTAFPEVPHPDLLIGSSINQSLMSMNMIPRELEFLSEQVRKVAEQGGAGQRR